MTPTRTAPQRTLSGAAMTFLRHARFAMAAAVVLAQPALAGAPCNASIPLTNPDARYTSTATGTVTDRATGLMWKTCAEGLSGATCTTGAALAATWQQALQQVATVNAAPGTLGAGFSDWRLPNRNELATLVERACSNPAINTTQFPGTPAQSFWTSTGYAQNGLLAWVVEFNVGDISPAVKAGTKNVRLVRGGN